MSFSNYKFFEGSCRLAKLECLTYPGSRSHETKKDMFVQIPRAKSIPSMKSLVLSAQRVELKNMNDTCAKMYIPR